MSLSLCVCCCTYGRPHLLPRIIECFRQQDYPHRFLLILDDGKQYLQSDNDQTGVELPEHVGLLVVGHRFRSLGTKRNFLAKLVEHRGFDAICPIDDDDLFLPWHLSATAAALEKAEWSRPSVVLTPTGRDGIFNQSYTGHRDDQTKERMYAPAHGIRLSAFNRVGGYPENQSGPEDKALMRKMEAVGVTQSDPIALGFRPSYVHCWTAGQSISDFLGPADPLGKAAWEKLGKPLPPATLERWEPTWDLHHPIIMPGIAQRGF